MVAGNVVISNAQPQLSLFVLFCCIDEGGLEPASIVGHLSEHHNLSKPQLKKVKEILCLLKLQARRDVACPPNGTAQVPGLRLEDGYECANCGDAGTSIPSMFKRPCLPSSFHQPIAGKKVARVFQVSLLKVISCFQIDSGIDDIAVLLL